MVTFRQVVLTKDLIYNMKASNESQKSKTTFVKLSQANYQNATNLYMESSYIAEASEYALNPYETYTDSPLISTNVFDLNLYNYTSRTYIPVSGLSNPFQIYFPVSDNYNLTSFASKMNSLNPYKTA
jgi:hypothetical protein